MKNLSLLPLYRWKRNLSPFFRAFINRQNNQNANFWWVIKRKLYNFAIWCNKIINIFPFTDKINETIELFNLNSVEFIADLKTWGMWNPPLLLNKNYQKNEDVFMESFRCF